MTSYKSAIRCPFRIFFYFFSFSQIDCMLTNSRSLASRKLRVSALSFSTKPFNALSCFIVSAKEDIFHKLFVHAIAGHDRESQDSSRE